MEEETGTHRKNFRFPKESIRQLEMLQKYWGEQTETGVVIRALEQAAARVRKITNKKK